MRVLPAKLLLPFVAIGAWLALAPAASAHHVVEGELEGVHADYFDRDTSTTRWQLETAHGTVGVMPTTLPALTQNDNQVALTDEDPGSGVAGPAKAVGPLASPTLGAHKLAVIAVNFLTDTSQPWTTGQIRAAIFGTGASANTFFKEETFNKLSLTGKVRADGDVYGWYTLPTAPTSCDYSTWATLAKTAAQAGGFNASGYQHIMYVFPEQAVCGWAGLAYMPGTESWINGDLTVRVTAHELGHNLGLNHAGSWFCTGASGQSVTISSNCALSEYNDPYDVMGAIGSRHNNGWHLEQLGVLAPTNVETVTTSGTYTLTSAFPQTSSPTNIRIPRTYAADNSVQDWYYLEVRKAAAGVFDNFLSTDWPVKGVSIRVVDDPSRLTRSRLLDTNPGGSIYDAPLPAGETFNDGRIAVTTVSAGAGTATVSVNMSAPPLDQQPPSTPTGLSHVLLSNGLRLSWNPSGDNVGVRSYTIDRDGYALATTSARSYDDTTVSAGRHVYTVYAQDAAHNQSPSSAPYVVDVPVQGAVQRRTTATVDRRAPRLRLSRKRLRHRVLLLTARATDASGIARLAIRIDGHRVRAGRKGKLRYRWHLRRGRHRIVVVAYDKRGNRATYRLSLRVRA